MDLRFLRLTHLADSALPIGSLSHSFGLESLIEEHHLDVNELPNFFRALLSETGMLEAVFCRQAGQLTEIETFLALNRELSARMTAETLREASLTLGRRFFALATLLIGDPRLQEWQLRLEAAPAGLHLCCAFGAIGRALGADPTTTTLAFLHQSIAGLTSACQRLLPLGQTRAAQILWDLKPAMLGVAERSAHLQWNEVPSFVPGLELASMRHAGLATRLFIS
jgi:urease accessory protein